MKLMSPCSYLCTHTHGRVKRSTAAIKTNVTQFWMWCHLFHKRSQENPDFRGGSDLGVLPAALRGRRNLGQPASVRAEKHHHGLAVLWRERHLPPRHLHQHTRAEVHQHKHPVHPHQPLQSLEGALPTWTGGRSRDAVHIYIDWLKCNLLMRDWRMCLSSGCRSWRSCVSKATKTLCTSYRRTVKPETMTAFTPLPRVVQATFTFLYLGFFSHTFVLSTWSVGLLELRSGD